MSRSVRLPFSFRQRVKHADWPSVDFIVLAQEADHTGSWTISVTDTGGGGFWRFPDFELTFADLVDEQVAIAEWMGCSVERMNAHHDQLHAWLSARAGLPSFSLKQSRSEQLTPDEAAIAAAEEDAVLHLQRYLCIIERARTYSCIAA